MIHQAADMIQAAEHVAVLTGAGVSAESGIPTFRDALTGLWARYDPAQLATPEAFSRDPALVTRWYDERRLRCAACDPNPAHHALVTLQQSRRLTLITQNVDRLHTRAGSLDVIEIHGNLFTWRCTRTGTEVEPPIEPFQTHPPLSEAGAPMRPGVVWFGEMLPARAMKAAHAALESCDLFMSVGTSALVHPAAGFVDLARHHGAATIEINADPTPITSDVDLAIQAPAGEVLPAVTELLGLA